MDHLTLTRMSTLKVEKTGTSTDRHMGKLEPSHTAGLNVDGEITVENGVAGNSSELSKELLVTQEIPLRGIRPRQSKLHKRQKKLYTSVQSDIVIIMKGDEHPNAY